MPLQIIDNGTARLLTSAERLEIARSINALSNAVAHSLSIPLDGDYVMTQQTVSGSPTYTLGTVVAGGSCTLRLLASGTGNSPTFPGVEFGTSMGYDNSVPGRVNIISFWSDDGINIYYSIGQPAAGTADTTKPTLVAASNVEGQTKIVLTFSETLQSTVTGTATLSGPSRTISSQTVVGGNTVEIVVSAAYVAGNSVAVSLPANYVRDAAGNQINAVSSFAVPVTPVSASVPVRLNSRTNLTESGDATAGWVYQGTKSSSGYGNYGISDLSIPASSEGYFEWRNGSPKNIAAGGLKTTAAAGGIATFGIGIQPLNNGSLRYMPLNNGATATPLVDILTGDGPAHRMRVGRYNVGGGTFNARAHVSTDSGATWTMIYEWPGVSTGQWWLGIDMDNTSPMTGLRGSGVS